ncbi:hypothetical protein BDZ88DRAFT_453814 [Geranomyces variabilis]|nr:hypothetical protein BDZ88DRAFT_453814 [Geranomyces variabilis]KAJ3135896.1 hypothetical protein HDU90_003637 [Geranomyces variabilis]
MTMHHHYHQCPSEDPLPPPPELAGTAEVAAAAHPDLSHASSYKAEPEEPAPETVPHHLPHDPNLIIKMWEQRKAKHQWTADEMDLLTALHLTDPKNTVARFIDITAPMPRSKVADKIKKMRAKGQLG